MASVKEHLDALNQCYGEWNELWVVLYSVRLENLPKLFNEVILLLKSNLFDDQQTRMIGTQDEEELIDDYMFYIVFKQLKAEFVILEDKLAFVEKSSQREKNQLKRSENRNKKSIEGFELKVSAQEFGHKIYDSRDKIFKYKELIIKSENVQLNYNEATLEWISYLINIAL